MKSYFLFIILAIVALVLFVYNLAFSGSVIAGYKEVSGAVYGVQPGCSYSVRAVYDGMIVGSGVVNNERFDMMLRDEDVSYVVGGFKCDVFSKVSFQDQVFLSLNCNYLPRCSFKSADVVGIGVRIGQSIGSKV